MRVRRRARETTSASWRTRAATIPPRSSSSSGSCSVTCRRAPRGSITDELFARYVTRGRGARSRESSTWASTTSATCGTRGCGSAVTATITTGSTPSTRQSQEREIDLSLDFLTLGGRDTGSLGDGLPLRRLRRSPARDCSAKTLQRRDSPTRSGSPTSTRTIRSDLAATRHQRPAQARRRDAPSEWTTLRREEPTDEPDDGAPAGAHPAEPGHLLHATSTAPSTTCADSCPARSSSTRQTRGAQRLGHPAQVGRGRSDHLEGRRDSCTTARGTRSASSRSRLHSRAGCRSRNLSEHLHYDHRYADSLTFHFRGLFRSWNRDWGFCVPQHLYDSLEPGDYDVRIVTREAPGVLKVGHRHARRARRRTRSPCARTSTIPASPTTVWPGWRWASRFCGGCGGRGRLHATNSFSRPGSSAPSTTSACCRRLSGSASSTCLCLWMLGSRTELALQSSRGGRIGHRAHHRRGPGRRRHPLPPRRVRDGHHQRRVPLGGVRHPDLLAVPLSVPRVPLLARRRLDHGRGPARGGRDHPARRDRAPGGARRSWRSASKARSACPTRVRPVRRSRARSRSASRSATSSAGCACSRTTCLRCAVQ